MSEVSCVSALIYCFQTFRKINIATFLYKKLSNSLFRKWLYYIIPIVVFSVNLFCMVHNKVLYSSEDEFTYLNDLSNSVCLTILYFLSYFLSGYYPAKLDEFINKGTDERFFRDMADYSKNKRTSFWVLLLIGAVTFCIGFAAGYSFYDVAKYNASAYWIHSLDNFGRLYYCMFLGLTWYHSLSLLGMALTSGFIVYKIIEYEHLNYIEDNFNKNISIMTAMDIVLSTFSYGLFYIIGSFLFIFNDRLAERYNVYNTFHEDIPSLILVLVISLIVIFAYLPLQELFSFLKKKKGILIDGLDQKITEEKIPEKKTELILKRDELIKQNLIYTTITNKVIFLLSVVIPSIGVVFQGIELFMR